MLTKSAPRRSTFSAAVLIIKFSSVASVTQSGTPESVALPDAVISIAERILALPLHFEAQPELVWAYFPAMDNVFELVRPNPATGMAVHALLNIAPESVQQSEAEIALGSGTSNELPCFAASFCADRACLG